MAGRSVKVKLMLDNKDFLSGLAKADKAVKKFSDSLGDTYEPFEKETEKQQRRAPRQAEETAGAFAKAFRRRLEAAFKQLPKAEIDAESSDAQVKIAEIRKALADLSGKTIGVDINTATALGELRTLQDELRSLEADSSDIDVRADTGAALAELQAIQAEVNRLGGATAEVDVDADTDAAEVGLRGVSKEVSFLDGAKAVVKVDADVTGALMGIGLVTGALASIPTGAVSLAAVGGLSSAFVTAGIAAASFGAVAGPTLGRINEALKEQEKAAEKAAKEAGDLTPKWTELSKAEKELAKNIKAFKDEYVDWQRSLAPEVFPAINEGMDLLTAGMKVSTPLVKASAGAFEELARSAKEGLQGEQWTSFFNDLAVHAPRAIEGLGTTTGNVFGMLAGIIEAFLPHTDRFMTFLEESTQKAEDWGQSLKGSPEFEAFMRYVSENGPKVGEVLGNIAEFAGKLLQAGAGAGGDTLDLLVSISEKLASMDPAQIQAIATGVGLLFAAFKAGAVLKLGAFVALAELLASMSPGQIQTLAMAITAVVIAVKGTQAASAAVGWFNNLSTALDRAGTSADGAKGKFAGLGGSLKAAGIAAGVAGIALAADNLTDELTGLNPDIDKLAQGITTFVEGGAPSPELLDQIAAKASMLDPSQWENFSDIASRLASENPFQQAANGLGSFMDDLSGGLITLDSGAQRMQNIDQALAAMVSSGNGAQAAQMFDMLARDAAAAGVPVETLRGLMPGYAEAMRVAGEASGQAAVGVNAVAAGLGTLQTSLDSFTARTDALQAVQSMKQAYHDAAAAIEAANGKLSVNAGMTDTQKNAVIAARESFSGYITSIKTAADGATTLSGKTADATRTILNQLPELGKLAGGNAEAKAQVLALAAAYGISASDARKAMAGGEGLREVLAKLKSKEIRVTAQTSQAKSALESLISVARNVAASIASAIGGALSGGASKVGSAGAAAVGAANKRANGGIFNPAGTQFMAAGGIRDLGSSPQAMIAGSPYRISGRQGPDVIFAEAGLEAYIPLAPDRRGRGLQILQQAAGIMGMAVVPEQMSINGPASSGGGGISMGAGYRPAMVTITGIDALRSTLDTTAVNLTSSLGQATSTLDATMGETGALTQSVTAVGEAAGGLTEQVGGLGLEVVGLGGTVDGFAGEVGGFADTMGEEIPPLTDSIDTLAAAVSSAKEAASGKGDERNPRSGDGSFQSASAKKSTKSLNGKKSGGTSASLKKETVALGSASAKKSTKPLAQSKTMIGGHVGTGTAGVAMEMGSGGTNWSKTSRPVQGSSGGSSSAGGSGAGGGLAMGGSTPLAGTGGLVQVQTLAVTEKADVDAVAAALYSRLGSKGK